ncbi:AAA family ATPase [Nocardia sp. NPDC058176]|uniref:helix-turn-helix transcriptional regulator n=1 Tax=Nocardia sp. NPDC058176 TaxID=3346368 RepID=UPI0036D9213B
MLRGREIEQARIDELIAGARAGRSGALVLRGEAGIGKSALLDYAAAQDLPTVRSAGIESEAELPFAALHLLIRPGMELVRQLPPRQRDALEAAFGLGDGTPADRMLIGLAVLTLLAEEAAEGPLLCLIDDAHWLDRATAEALLFAARRLDAEGVVMLFATRPGPDDFPAPGLPELALGGLRPDAAAALLDAGGANLSPTTRYRLLTESGGNPLALLELPSVLGETAVDEVNPVPLTQRLQLAFHGRVARLPTATRTVLLVAAAVGAQDLAPVLRAVTLLGAELADLQPAQDAGLVKTDGQALSWRHPLLRAAVYQGAALTDRLSAHRALAEALDAEDTADLRAWHLACAATGPDERAASALEDTATRARIRNGFHGAVAAYDRAAALSVDVPARTRRLVLGAETATEAGLTDQAARLADRAAAQSPDDTLESRLELVRAQTEFARGTTGSAHRRLMTAAVAARGDDPGAAARILSRAVHTAWYLGAAELDEVAQALDTLTLDDDDPITPIMRYLTTAVAGRRTIAQGATDRGTRDPGTGTRDPDAGDPGATDISAADPGTAEPSGPGGRGVDLRTAAGRARGNGADSPADLVQLCGSGLVVGQDAQVGELAEELIGEAREQGRIALLAPLLFFRSEAQLFEGRPGESLVAAEEGVRIAADIGQAHWVSQLSAFLAYLAALRGDGESCRVHAERAVAEEFGGAGSAGAPWAHAARALAALGAGRLEQAHAELEHLTVEPARHQVVGLRTLADRIEVAARLGATDRACEALDRLTDWSEQAGQAWIAALAARGRALVADGSAAEAHFAAALTANRPFDEARTRLLYGEWLRRDKRKVDARTQLEQALEVFDRLDARPWSARARTELGALGVGVDAAASSGALSTLTPQESQIVRLAAQGLSNREIAARLFLSHRTVGHHLYKAYPKLGVVSRGELSALDLAP